MDDIKERVRRRLDGELAQVERRLASLRDEDRPQELEAGGDNTPLSEAADRAQVVEERETGTQLLDALVERSVDLQRALQRLDDGTYGTCESCGASITPQRLLAVPEATFCLDCQDESERRHAEATGVPHASGSRTL